MPQIEDLGTWTRDFWAELDTLAADSEMIVDRPRGSRHPRYSDTVYPLDYGYLVGTTSGDGDGVDVWVGSLHPRRVVGVVAAVDTLQRDLELKLLLGCTEEEARTILAFHNQGAQHAMLIMRGDAEDGPESRITSP